MMEREFNIEKYINLIKEATDLKALKDQLVKLHYYELAQLFYSLSDYDLMKLYSIFSNEEIGEILAYLDSDEALELIEDLNVGKIAKIINTMEPDDAIDIIQEFDKETQEQIIDLLDTDQKETVSELITYEEDTAGSIMNSNYIAIQSGSDIRKIMKAIVSRAPEVESITTSFVVDESGALLGILDLKKLIRTKAPALVDEIMDTNFKFVETSDSLEYATNIINKYDIYTLPVLENKILKGIITMDDAFQEYVEESEDDYVKFAAVSEVLEADAPLIDIVKTRLPWLVLLLFTNIIIALVISRFDYLFSLDALSILVLFQPLIIGLAGNCGTQSLGVTISEISKSELDTKKQVIIHTLKEIGLGLAIGLVIAIISSLLAYFVLKGSETPLDITNVIFTIAVSISVSIVSANFFGTIIPIFLYKLNVDPAAASGPLITTIIDVIAIVIYYVLATILLYNKLI